jgi:hypothetical protein
METVRSHFPPSTRFTCRGRTAKQEALSTIADANGIVETTRTLRNARADEPPFVPGRNDITHPTEGVRELILRDVKGEEYGDKHQETCHPRARQAGGLRP